MKNLKIFFKLLLLVTVFAFPAFASETVKGAKKDLAVFRQEMNVKLQTLEREIVKLKAQAKVEGREARARAILELEQARDEVKADLATLENKSESTWQKIKNRVAVTLDRLNAKAQRALAE